jgi:translation initiation factor IF-3
VNNAIRAREVRVVAPDGSQVGVKKIEEALWLADQLGLDLVEVAPDAKPPVCRMMDYGKYKYEQSVKQREARKKQTRTVIKEVRLRPRIGEHDFQIVRRRAQEFLSEGDKVKVTVRFRGRENERPELGHRLAERLFEELQDLAIVEQSARKDGRTMTMVMAPTRKALDLAAAAKEGKSSHKPTGKGHKDVIDGEVDPVVDEVVDGEVDLAVDEIDGEAGPVVDEVVDGELDDAIDDTDAAGDGD